MRILVIRFSSLGDVLLTTSVIRPLHENGITIDFLTFTPFDQLLEKDSRIKNIIKVNKKDLKNISAIIDFSKSLKGYDLILDLHSNLRSLLIGHFSGIPVVRYRKNSIKRRLYTKPFFRRFIKDSFNVVDAYSEALGKIGIKPEEIRPEVVLKKEEIENVKKYLPYNFIVIGAGARYKNKSYPYFQEVSSLFLKNGINVVLVGTNSDKKFDTKPFPEGVIDLRGKLSLRESLSVISTARTTISNDSAVAHMSRAVKTPLLMIYGATHPYFGFYPFDDEGDYILKGLPCQPCDLHGKKECRFKNAECLNIDPELVYSKALNIMKNSL